MALQRERTTSLKLKRETAEAELRKNFASEYAEQMIGQVRSMERMTDKQMAEIEDLHDHIGLIQAGGKPTGSVGAESVREAQKISVSFGQLRGRVKQFEG